VPVPGHLSEESEADACREVAERGRGGVVAPHVLGFVAVNREALNVAHLSHALERLTVGLYEVLPVRDRGIKRRGRAGKVGKFHVVRPFLAHLWAACSRSVCCAELIYSSYQSAREAIFAPSTSASSFSHATSG